MPDLSRFRAIWNIVRGKPAAASFERREFASKYMLSMKILLRRKRFGGWCWALNIHAPGNNLKARPQMQCPLSKASAPKSTNRRKTAGFPPPEWRVETIPREPGGGW